MVRPASESPRDKESGKDGESMAKETETATDTAKKKLLDTYLSPYAIVPQMKKILESFEDINVTTEVLGRTTEFNDIVLFKISSTKNGGLTRFRSLDHHKYDDTNPEKKIIFIVHGLTVMGMNQLSCLSEKDPFKILLSYYLKHLDKFDIFLIPMANPDGFAATMSNQGVYYWNKNMSPQADCSGVMLDRNFDVEFNNSHDMSSCSQAYPGPTPFSEIETKAISNVFHFHGHRMLAYIHVHAGTYSIRSFKGDAVLYPHGYTDILGDDDKYFDIKDDIDDSMRNATFRVMTVTMENLYHWYGKVLGTSVDYASKIFGINYAMEFVMQLYDYDYYASQDQDQPEYNALTIIWKRIISVVFKHFAKSVGIIYEDFEE